MAVESRGCKFRRMIMQADIPITQDTKLNSRALHLCVTHASVNHTHIGTAKPNQFFRKLNFGPLHPRRTLLDVNRLRPRRPTELSRFVFRKSSREKHNIETRLTSERSRPLVYVQNPAPLQFHYHELFPIVGTPLNLPTIINMRE